jgi:signal transduction histidine kinase/ligand-binding sensor domain-containing protein/CheY-like chemotaxis protein
VSKRTDVPPALPALFQSPRDSAFRVIKPLIAVGLFLIGAVNGIGAAAAPLDGFVRMTDDEGLAHSDVRAIAQDQEGFIWFGLRLGGLTRFDGYELTVHQHDPKDPRSIGNQIIWSLLVDRGGTLWIGTEGGLDRYDRASDSFVHHRTNSAKPASSLPNNVVTCLFEDAGGTLWAGTREGLARMDDREKGLFTTFRRPQVVEGSTAKDTIRSITEDVTTGLLWLGTSDGLAAFDPRTGAFATFLHDPKDPQSLSRNAVNKVLRDERGLFWAMTEYGLNSFRPAFDRVPQHSVQQPRIVFKRFVLPGSEASPGNNFVRDGLVDQKDRLWLATRGGVQYLDREKEQFTSYRRRPGDSTSLSDDLVQSIFEDRIGNIWVGTYAGGANRLRSETKPFRVHQHRPGNPQTITDDRVSGLAFDAAGRLWATTVRGLNRFENGKWTQYLPDPGNAKALPSNDLSTIAVAQNGDIWLGTNYAGPYRFDGRRFHVFATSPSSAPAPNGSHAFTGDQVNSILTDEHGGVWLGARAYGVDYYHAGRFVHFNPQDPDQAEPTQPTTNAVFGVIAQNGDVWFGTESKGLIRFSKETQTFQAFYPPVEHVGATRSFHCVAGGDDGVIWVGAADGLLKFDTKTQKFAGHYTTDDGLPHDAVMTIVRDRRGHLWVGTANGLADFDPKTNKSRVYEKPDGLPSNVFSQRAGALGPDGRVYLGTRAGIVDFAPSELKDNPVPPPVIISELRWLGVPPLVNGSRPRSMPNVGEVVRVSPGQLGFSIRFSALDFAAPEKNRFRYCLDGLDSDWTASAAHERSATYTSLRPGTYTFRVQASNADQVWNERGASVRIIVEPHFWQTTGFILSLVGLAIASIVAAIHFRLRTVRRRNAWLEQQVSQRTGELQEEVAVRQRAETALRESHGELEHRVQNRTAELARTNASLQAEVAERKRVEAQLRQSQKMEAVGQLAGGVAHDFNNLLTVILGQSELLSEDGGGIEEREAAIRDIKAAAQRATNLTRQLLVFSRHQAVNPVPVDLNAIVGGISKLLRHVIGEHLALSTPLCAGSLGVLADPGMLEQVLLNMAVNARDAMPRGGQLTIATDAVTLTPEQALRIGPHARPGQFACVSVRDTGTGVAPEILAQIFEPFFTTKEAGKGTGLGLAISLGIVQQHGGWIDVQTCQGLGTTFHVYLPRHAAKSQLPAASPKSRPQAQGNTTILVVEDESAVRSLVQRLLTRQGYRVIEAASGDEALTVWDKHADEISILLTDIVMPGRLNGHELANQLSARKSSLRVITMSGYDPKEVAGGKSSGPHLRKPFTTEDLLTAIEGTSRNEPLNGSPAAVDTVSR